MPWFKVDDHFHSHRKVKRCGLEVVGLWTVAGSYCMAHLTDGFVDDWFVKEWPRGLKLAALLVRNGLWIEAEKDGEKGWQFHDWEKYQPTKKQVEAEREKARQRKAAQRLSHGESRRDSQVDSDRDSQGESREIPGTIPARPPDPPVPSLVDSGGEVTQVAATEPPPRCPRHLNHTDPPPCQGCRKAREANEAWNAGEFERRRVAREAAKAVADSCKRCQGTNWVHDSEGKPLEPAVKCNHQEAS